MTVRIAPFWVWVSRAEPGASETATRLIALGYWPIVAPMIRTTPLEALVPIRSAYDALAFTSSAAVSRFAALSSARDETVFTVGDATADVVRTQGWTQVISADADVAGLGAVLAREAKGLRILHPCAQAPADDLAHHSRGVEVEAMPLYATVLERSWPKPVLDALAEADGAVLIHSPSAARAIAMSPQASDYAAQLTAFALSEACASPITALRLREIVVAPFPKETALLKVMTETLRR